MLRSICCCCEPAEEIDFKELLSDVSVGSSTAAVEPGSVGLEGSATRVVEWDELKDREHLGSGAFCDIFAATLGGERVAVKALRREQEQSPTAVRDLENEVRIMSQLSHPSILRVVATGRARRAGGADLPFLVLELLQSPLSSLLPRPVGEVAIWERMAAVQRWPLRRALLAALQLAQALRYCHEAQPVPGMRVLHRDLKPDNLGILPNGRLVLLDFGLAKLWPLEAAPDGQACQLTGETGSARYMAPEVALSRPYDHTAEVFSFGLIAWQLVAHEKPFGGMAVEQFRSRVAEAGERPRCAEHFPATFRHLLERCWHAEPSRRPSFRSIVSELTALVQAQSPAAGAHELVPCDIEDGEDDHSPSVR